VPGPAILIAPAEVLPALSARLVESAPGLQTFPDTDALRALEAITKSRPSLVILERRFSLTSRGAALIARIKADPSLTDTEVRVLPTESEPPAAAPSAAATAREARPASTARHSHAVAGHVIQELDYSGTRGAPRHRVSGGIEVLVDGQKAILVDLSTSGAQILSQLVLKPSQRVRVSFSDPQGTLRFVATVAWASFEIPKGSGSRYRAGLEFVDADSAAIDAFGRRHRHE
jgi:hypothetical protein